MYPSFMGYMLTVLPRRYGMDSLSRHGTPTCNNFRLNFAISHSELFFCPSCSILNLNISIMRRNIFSSSPFQTSPKRRRIDNRSAGSHKMSGIIDQKLIDGSQRPQETSSFSTHFPMTQEPVSSVRDDEDQLDAFGR